MLHIEFKINLNSNVLPKVSLLGNREFCYGQNITNELTGWEDFSPPNSNAKTNVLFFFL